MSPLCGEPVVFLLRREETLRRFCFVHPHGVCFDRQGNSYIVEWVHTGRVTFMRRVS